MKEEINKLIASSSILTEKQKGIYLAMLPNLSEEKMQGLLDILKKEQKMKAEIDEDKKKKLSEANMDYIESYEGISKKEIASAVEAIEEEDSLEAEKLLNDNF